MKGTKHILTDLKKEKSCQKGSIFHLSANYSGSGEYLDTAGMIPGMVCFRRGFRMAGTEVLPNAATNLPKLHQFSLSQE